MPPSRPRRQPPSHPRQSTPAPPPARSLQLLTRALALFAILAIFCPQSQAQVQKGCDGASLDDGNTTPVLGRGRPATFWDTPCQDNECRAIKDIDCAITGLANRLTPNTMAYLSPRHAERAQIQYGLNIWSLGREHPRRIPLYCKLLAHVATTLTGDKEKDRRTASNIIELAVILDRPHHHCLAEVMAAVPSPAAAQSETAWGWDCLHKIRACQRWTDREYGPKRAGGPRAR